MRKEKVDTIFQILAGENPTPRTELEFNSEFMLLCAILLSAQSNDKTVNKATKILFAEFKTPNGFVDLGVDELKPYIKTIGLYNNKAKNIIALSAILIESFGGRVPNRFDDLISLPGIGRKSANVFLNTIYGYGLIGVDTHIHRVANRLGLANSASALQTEKQLMSLVPEKWLSRAHNWLVLHGRYVCLARKPKCSECKIREFCEFSAENLRRLGALPTKDER